MGLKLIICGRSVKWLNEGLRQLVKNCRACYAQGLKNESNWSDYFKRCKDLKQKIREKIKICREGFMANGNSNYSKNIKVFWKFVNGSVKLMLRIKLKDGLMVVAIVFLVMQVR